MHFLSNMTDIQLAASPHLKRKASNIYYQETRPKMRLSEPHKHVFKKSCAVSVQIVLPLSQNVHFGCCEPTSLPPTVNRLFPGVQLIKGIATKGITTAVAQFLELGVDW